MNCEVWSVLGTSFSGIHFENGVIRQLWLFPFYNRDHRFKKVEWQLQDDFLTLSVILEYLLLDTEASSLLGKSKYWHTTGFSFKDVTWRNHWAFLVAVVQSLSQAQLFATPWTAAQKASLSFNICWSLLKLLFIESVMPSNHLILCHPLLLLPSIFPSISIFSNESALHIRWPKYWSFSFSISPSNEYSWLISFKIDWFGLLAVLGTLKSLL